MAESKLAARTQAHPAPEPSARAANDRLNASPRVGQLKAIGARLNANEHRGDAVVQRVVMHKLKDGVVRYYSSYRPSVDYATSEEAEAADALLRADPSNISHALTTSQGRDRRMPTPFSYNPDLSVSGAVRSQSSGPHTVSFSSTEYRLTKRLSKGQSHEIDEQIDEPEEFERKVDEEMGDDWDEGRHRERLKLDYRSIHKRHKTLRKGKDKGVGSEYHEVSRRLMQLDPYVTYGRKKGSRPNGERRRAPFGTGSIDMAGKSKFRSKKNYKAYLKRRMKIFHESDTEDDRSDYEDYVFSDDEDMMKKHKKGPPDDDPDDPSSGGPSGSLTGGILVE